jgi:hypothetical protein
MINKNSLLFIILGIGAYGEKQLIQIGFDMVWMGIKFMMLIISPILLGLLIYLICKWLFGKK